MDGVRMRIRLGRSQSAVGRAACLSVGHLRDAKPLSSLKGLLVVVRRTPDLRPGFSFGVAARLGSPSLHSPENQTKLSHGLLLGELMTVVAAASEVRGKNLAGPVMSPA